VGILTSHPPPKKIPTMMFLKKDGGNISLLTNHPPKKDIPIKSFIFI